MKSGYDIACNLVHEYVEAQVNHCAFYSLNLKDFTSWCNANSNNGIKYKEVE